MCVFWNLGGVGEAVVSSFPRAAITKYYRLGGVNNRISLSSSSVGWKSNIKVPSELPSDKSTLLLYAGVERNRYLVSHLHYQI